MLHQHTNYTRYFIKLNSVILLWCNFKRTDKQFTFFESTKHFFFKYMQCTRETYFYYIYVFRSFWLSSYQTKYVTTQNHWGFANFSALCFLCTILMWEYLEVPLPNTEGHKLQRYSDFWPWTTARCFNLAWQESNVVSHIGQRYLFFGPWTSARCRFFSTRFLKTISHFGQGNWPISWHFWCDLSLCFPE